MGKRVRTRPASYCLRRCWDRAAEGRLEITDSQLYTIKALFVFSYFYI